MFITNEGKKVYLDNICGEWDAGIIIVHEDGNRIELPKHVDSDTAYKIAVMIYPMDEERTDEYNEYINQKNSMAGRYY